MQEVVELPRLVADPEVVRVVAHDVGEDHEVRDEDLVHAPDGLEGVQVVLGGLRLDVRGLAGEVGARRVDALAARREHRRHRMLGEPVDLQLGMEQAELVRDREVAPRVPEPDGRGDVERAPAPARAAPPAGGGRRRRDDVAQHQVDPHRIPADRQVAGALEREQLPARGGGERRTLRVRADAVLVALDDEHGAADARGASPRALAGRQLRPAGRVGQRLGRRLEPPADAVLDLLGRVRLAARLREEELEELAIAGRGEMAVERRPRVAAARLLLERIDAAVRQRDVGRDGDEAIDALGMAGGEQAAPPRAGGEADERRPLEARRVHHGERVRGVLGVGIRRCADRPVRAAVAAAVEGHDAAVAGEIRELRLPDPRVHDRPRGQQEHGRPVAAVDLVGDPHAGAIDVPVRVRIPGARLLARVRPRLARPASADPTPPDRYDGRACASSLSG